MFSLKNTAVNLLIVIGFVSLFNNLNTNDGVETHYKYNPLMGNAHKEHENKIEFACEYTVWSHLNDAILGDTNSLKSKILGDISPDIEVGNKREAEKLAFRISPDGKTAYLLTATGVGMGATEADPIPVITNNDNFLLASSSEGLTDVKTLFFDKRTYRGVYSYTGLGPSGLEVTGHYVECR
jgi:hypothetical protein